MLQDNIKLTLKVNYLVKEFECHQRFFELAQKSFESDSCQMVVTGEIAIEVHHLTTIDARLHFTDQSNTGRTPEQAFCLESCETKFP